MDIGLIHKTKKTSEGSKKCRLEKDKTTATFS